MRVVLKRQLKRVAIGGVFKRLSLNKLLSWEPSCYLKWYYSLFKVKRYEA